MPDRHSLNPGKTQVQSLTQSRKSQQIKLTQRLKLTNQDLCTECGGVRQITAGSAKDQNFKQLLQLEAAVFVASWLMQQITFQMRLLTLLVGDFQRDSKRELKIRKAIMCQPKTAWIETVRINKGLAEAQRLCPYLVWIDLNPNCKRGFELIESLKGLAPKPYIVMTTPEPDIEFVRRGIQLEITDVFLGDLDDELQSFVDRIERKRNLAD